MRRAASALAAFLAGLPAAAISAEGTGPIRLLVTGDRGAEFEATCTLEQQDGRAETVRFTTSPPFERSFEGGRLQCTLQTGAGGGRLVIEISGASGNRSRAAVSGSDSSITISIQ